MLDDEVVQPFSSLREMLSSLTTATPSKRSLFSLFCLVL
jgi:hypothetical protein